MVKRSSKKGQKIQKARRVEIKVDGKKRSPKEQKGIRKFFWRLKVKIQSAWRKLQDFRAQHIHLHKSFKRSYREDYARPTKTPGLLSHAMLTFKQIFKHWRTFGLLLVLMTGLYITLVGLMSEEFYSQMQDTVESTNAELAQGELGSFAKAGLLLISTITTGGLDTGMGDVQTVFMILLFLMIWLVVIFLLRHFLAGEKPKLRDGLYNAFAPLFSTLLIFILVFVQCIPIMLVVITYSAAVMTNFLATPFYALVYFIFAALMILLSCYLLSSSLIALIAVTAPGLYPMKAVLAASDMMAGRRVKFIIRLIYLIIVVVLIYIIVMLPVILLDMWLKGMINWLKNWPIVPFFLLVVTCFVFIYLATYLYLYYRWLLEQEN